MKSISNFPKALELSGSFVLQPLSVADVFNPLRRDYKSRTDGFRIENPKEHKSLRKKIPVVYAVSDFQSGTGLSRIYDPLIGIVNPKERESQTSR